TAWEQTGTGLPPVAVYGITIDPGSHLLFAATHGRGAWRLALPVPPAAPAPPPPADTTTTATPAATVPAMTPAPTVVRVVSRPPRLVSRRMRRHRDAAISLALLCPPGHGTCSG